MVCTWDPLLYMTGLPNVHFWREGWREEASLPRGVPGGLFLRFMARREPPMGLYPRVMRDMRETGPFASLRS